MKFDGIDHSATTENITELIDFHKSNCNKHTNGVCYNRKCLIRGGWNKIGPSNPEAATCEYSETVVCLLRLLQENKICLQKANQTGEIK